MKQIKILKHPNNAALTSVGLMKSALEQAQMQGVTTGEIRNRIKVLDKIEALAPDAEAIELEDAELKTLSEAAGKAIWGIVDKFIIEFDDSLKQAEK